jgi:hypothetical protein
VLTSELTVTRSTIDLFQGEVMSVRKAFVFLVSLSAIAFMAACGSGGSAPANAVPPPTGGSFSNSNLNGTYVFALSGTDANSDPVSVVGTLTANGSGTITGGAVDMNDVEFTAPAPNLPIKSSSYNITVDGRGETKLNVTNPFGSTLTLDFVLQDNSHGLVSEFDAVSNGTGATGSGTIDLQSAGTPTGAYAFGLSGAGVTSSASVDAFAAVGNFAVAAGGGIAGTADFNEGAFPYTGQALSGKVVLGPSSSPATQITTAQFGTQTFDAVAIDSTHLKFIEMDTGGTLTGDAYSQPSTTIPTGNLAFTLAGSYPGASTVSAAGGIIVTDGSGNITDSSSVDSNNGGTVSPSPAAFTGTYTAAGTGRYTLTLTTFSDGSAYVAYPSSNGVFLLEVDPSGVGIMSGAAYTQSSTATLGVPDGYAFNLSGVNGGSETGSSSEVDEIAEFATASGGTLTGIIDENSLVQTVIGIPLDGTFSTPSGGRGQISATASNNSESTLEGGLSLTYYTVDGTTFPFIETDSGQVATGVFVLQSSTGSSSAVAKSHAMYVPHPLIHPHSAKQEKN